MCVINLCLLRSNPIDSRNRRFQRRDTGRGQWRGGGNLSQAITSTYIKPMINTQGTNTRVGENDWFKVTVSVAVHITAYLMGFVNVPQLFIGNIVTYLYAWNSLCLHCTVHYCGG